MTSPISVAPAVVAAVSPRRRLLRRVAIAACLPYLSLKIAWIAGSHLGIPDGSPLLAHRLTMVLANGLTVLMDAAVVVLALLLTRPWGLRVPARLLAVPMWTATGLLAPIMVGFPLELVTTAVHGAPRGGGDDGRFLADWVFGVVYGGFIVQGLALGALFAGYARDRWGHLWRGRTGELPPPGPAAGMRVAAVAAALTALFPGVLRLLWACGVTAGLRGGQHPGDRSLEAMYLAFLAVSVLGGLQLAFRRGRRLPVTVPLALAWTGSGAMACWGAWTSLSALAVPDDLNRPTPLMTLVYAVQMLSGLLVASVAARFLMDRSARAPR